jgi:hypothetical protein
MGRSLLSPSALATSFSAHVAVTKGNTNVAHDLIEWRRMAAFAVDDVDEGAALIALVPTRTTFSS